MKFDFDLFISYGTAVDYRLARDLESFLESVHRLEVTAGPPLRELRVCRDGSDFHVSHHTGETAATIELYLGKSEELLVLCSRTSRESVCVRDEVKWFLKNRGPEGIRLAITEGSDVNLLEHEVFAPELIEAGLHRRIAYDFRGFRGRASRAWRAVRFYDDERLRLAADLNGRPLSAIQPIWVAQQRRTARRQLQTASAAAILMAGLAAFGWYERHQARERGEETRRQLYVSSVNLAQRAWSEGSLDFSQRQLDAQIPRQGEDDLRDFDWFHLSPRTHARVASFSTPRVAAGSVSISADGKLLAAGGRRWAKNDLDRTALDVCVWSLETGNRLWTLKGHTREIVAVAFSPAEPLLATASENEVRLWDPLTGKLRRTLTAVTISGRPLDPNVSSLAFSPDGKWLAGSEGGAILLWDRDFHPLSPLIVSSDRLSRPAFSPDSKRFVVGDSKGKVFLWDVELRRQIRVLGSHQDAVNATVWVPGSTLAATGGDDKRVLIWNTAASDREPTELVQTDYVESLAVNKRLELAVGFGSPVQLESGRAISLWELGHQTRRGEIRGLKGRVLGLEYTPDGSRLAAAADGEDVSLWDAARAQFMSVIPTRDAPVWSLSFSAAGDKVTAAMNGGYLQQFDLVHGTALTSPKVHSWRVESVSVDPSGHYIASTGFDHSVRLWDRMLTSPGRELTRAEGWGFVEVAFSPDGSHLAAAGSCQGTVLIWRMEDLKLLPHPDKLGCPVFVAWSPDGSILASGGSETAESVGKGAVYLWRIRESVATKSLPGSEGEPQCAGFSRDGKALAVGYRSGEVRVWDLATKTVRTVLNGHRGAVNAVEFSPRGRIIVSAGEDHTVRLWDIATGQPRATLIDSPDEIYALRFRPDGKMLAAGTGNGTIIFWRSDDTHSPPGERLLSGPIIGH